MRDYRSNFLRSLAHEPGAVVAVVAGSMIGAMAVHSYAHKHVELGADHRAGLYATQPVVLPDIHQPEQAPPEPPGQLITAMSTASVSTSGPILWFIPGGWPPSST